MKEWFDRLIGKTADENVIKDSTMMQTKRAIEQAQKQSQKRNLMIGSIPDNRVDKFPSVNYNDAEIARQQLQQAYSQTRNPYMATTSTPNGVATNIPGQRNLNLLQTGGYYNSPTMPGIQSPYHSTHRHFIDLTDEEKAFVITNMLGDRGIREVSLKVLSLVNKEMIKRNPQPTPETKQPKKKLEL